MDGGWTCKDLSTRIPSQHISPPHIFAHCQNQIGRTESLFTEQPTKQHCPPFLFPTSCAKNGTHANSQVPRAHGGSDFRGMESASAGTVLGILSGRRQRPPRHFVLPRSSTRARSEVDHVVVPRPVHRGLADAGARVLLHFVQELLVHALAHVFAAVLVQVRVVPAWGGNENSLFGPARRTGLALIC